MWHDAIIGLWHLAKSAGKIGDHDEKSRISRSLLDSIGRPYAP